MSKSTVRTVHDIAERFWARVKKAPEGSKDCWIWMGKPNGSGYGLIRIAGVSDGHILAHRVSWELAYGPVPDGKHVLHHCDNPPCVRPDHLFLGDQISNTADRDAKGRTATGDRHGAHTKRATNYFVKTHGAGFRGEKHGMAKLSDEDIALFRQQWAAGKYRSKAEAGRAFGICPTYAAYLIKGIYRKEDP